MGLEKCFYTYEITKLYERYEKPHLFIRSTNLVHSYYFVLSYGLRKMLLCLRNYETIRKVRKPHLFIRSTNLVHSYYFVLSYGLRKMLLYLRNYETIRKVRKTPLIHTINQFSTFVLFRTFVWA